MQTWIAQLIANDTPVLVYTEGRTFATVILGSDDTGIAFNVDEKAIVVPWTAIHYIVEK